MKDLGGTIDWCADSRREHPEATPRSSVLPRVLAAITKRLQFNDGQRFHAVFFSILTILSIPVLSIVRFILPRCLVGKYWSSNVFALRHLSHILLSTVALSDVDVVAIPRRTFLPDLGARQFNHLLPNLLLC